MKFTVIDGGGCNSRFIVVEDNGKYFIKDTTNNKFVRCAFSVPPKYGKTDWGDLKSAIGFANCLDSIQNGHE